MDFSLVLSFLWFSLLLTLAPGPDIIFVLTESVTMGRKNAIAIAAGLVSGVFVHTALAATGVSLLLYSSKTAFSIVKYAGAAYLVYLAILAVKEKTESIVLSSKSAKGSYFKLFKTGFIMNVLNPKVSLFFIAFLPQFITPGGFAPWAQMLVLGIIFLLQAFIIFAAVSFFAAAFSGFMREKSFWVYAKYLKCVVYLVIALKLLL